MMLPVFIFFPLLAILVYWDSRRLRERGVRVYPGLVATAYLLFLMGVLLFNILTHSINGYILLFIPLAAYILFRVLSSKLSRPTGVALSLAPRWSFWLFIVAFPVLSIAFYIYSLGWVFGNLGGH